MSKNIKLLPLCTLCLDSQSVKMIQIIRQLIDEHQIYIYCFKTIASVIFILSLIVTEIFVSATLGQIGLGAVWEERQG